jgi:hypothetical protein
MKKYIEKYLVKIYSKVWRIEMNKTFFCIIALLLFSCKTLETYIENINNYEQIELVVPDNSLITFGKSGIHIQNEVLGKNFQKKTLIMDEYFLVETGQISVFTNVPPKGKSGSYHSSVGGKYNFYKKDLCLTQFEIVTDSTITVFSNDLSIGNSERYILIRNNDGSMETRITPNATNSEIYINIFDESTGNIAIKKYESRSANQPSDSPWKYQTGFIIEINYEEYGILAFYPNLIFYKNNTFEENIDEETKDKIILYIFMAYESFNRNDDIFKK